MGESHWCSAEQGMKKPVQAMQLAKWPSTSYDGMEDALKQDDAQPDVSLTTLSKARPQGLALSKSSASPSASCITNAEVFSTESDKHHMPIKILQNHFGYLCLTHI